MSLAPQPGRREHLLWENRKISHNWNEENLNRKNLSAPHRCRRLHWAPQTCWCCLGHCCSGSWRSPACFLIERKNKKKSLSLFFFFFSHFGKLLTHLSSKSSMRCYSLHNIKTTWLMRLYNNGKRLIIIILQKNCKIVIFLFLTFHQNYCISHKHKSRGEHKLACKHVCVSRK